MRITTFLLKTAKGVYDILAAYLLAWILLFALVSYGLHLGLEALADARGFGDATTMWLRLSQRTGIDPLWLRLGVALPLHALLLWALQRPRRSVFAALERVVDRALSSWRKLSERAPLPKLRGAYERYLDAAFNPSKSDDDSARAPPFQGG